MSDDDLLATVQDLGDESSANYVALLEQFHNADADNDGKLYKDVSRIGWE